MPSFMEAFGRTAAEAFSMRKPVVASGIGGLRDIVEMNENGLVYSVRDFEGLADEIMAAYQMSPKSASVSKKRDLERQAASAK